MAQEAWAGDEDPESILASAMAPQLWLPMLTLQGLFSTPKVPVLRAK